MQLDDAAVENVYKWFDMLFRIVALFVVGAGAMVVLILWGGDWDFWTDWKDRQNWPLIAPVMNIIVPALVQYILWTRFRLPFGATATAVLLVLLVSIDRVVNFVGWTYFPLNFVWPATFIPQAILLDLILLWTRSFLLTAALGGMMWGGLFYFINWVMLAPFLQPVDYNGHIMTVADVQGFEYVRTQTPEYARVVEEGALRAFVEEITYVVALFAGVVSVATYGVGHLIGKYTLWPVDKFLKRLY